MGVIRKYRKKPIVIQAVQWTGDNLTEIYELAGNTSAAVEGVRSLHIFTREGTLRAEKRDYIIRGVEGEIYPCGEEIFHKTYEELVDNV